MPSNGWYWFETIAFLEEVYKNPSIMPYVTPKQFDKLTKQDYVIGNLINNVFSILCSISDFGQRPSYYLFAKDITIATKQNMSFLCRKMKPIYNSQYPCYMCKSRNNVWEYKQDSICSSCIQYSGVAQYFYPYYIC